MVDSKYSLLALLAGALHGASDGPGKIADFNIPTTDEESNGFRFSGTTGYETQGCGGKVLSLCLV